MVLEKGHVEARSELQGEQQFGLNQIWMRPQSHGHMNSSPKVILREELARR
jgi:hypothetical protein